MIASDLIQSQIPVLRLTDTIKTALSFLEEYKLSQVPVIGPKGYIGLLEEEDALGATEISKIKDLQHVLLNHKIQVEEPLYSALSYFSKTNLSLLPVLDENQKYLGCLTAADLFKKTCEWLNVDELGGLLHLEIKQQDYSLVQISQIIEASDAKIISLVCIPNKKEPTLLEVIIKINREELSSIIQTFERYEYKIIATHHKNIHQKGLDDRFGSFIRYLNI